MVGQRRDVALQAANARPDFLQRPLAVVGNRRVIGEHPVHRQKALTGHRDKIALAADIDDDLLKVRCFRGFLARIFVFEHFPRDRIDLGADLLQGIGDAVDERFHQAQHHLFAGSARHRIGTLDAQGEHHERPRFRIAHGHQGRALENEGDRRQLRFVGVDPRHRGHRHEFRAVLVIEPGGDLDLLHFFARRDRHTNRRLYIAILFRGRIEEVEPGHSAFRKRLLLSGIHIDGVGNEVIAVAGINTQHAALPILGRRGASRGLRIRLWRGHPLSAISRWSAMHRRTERNPAPPCQHIAHPSTAKRQMTR